MPMCAACLVVATHETALIVDDDRVLRAFLRYALEEPDYAVLEAGDGLEALGAIWCALPYTTLHLPGSMPLRR